MTRLHVLRVFTAPDGRGGNPLGVVLDGGAVPPDGRQRLAAELGFSETVFVDDAASGVVRIFTPAVELPFAGHPLVGTSWLLADLGREVATLRPPAGSVATWHEPDATWIRGRPEWAPAMDLVAVGHPRLVDALTGPPSDAAFVYVWAWEDETAGRVRARAFASGVGVGEDEATGAAAVRLGALLGRRLQIRQGSGSRLLTRPGPDGSVDVGGTVALDEVRALPSPGVAD